MDKIIKESFYVENVIYDIRGKEVILDTDLAKLYQVETKRVNEAVKNNPEKFPERFIIRLSENEYMSLKSKISTSKGGSRKGHTAFTEQGVYMLATVLRSKVATEVSIAIMDAFVKMRHYINLNKYVLPNRVLLLEEKVDDNKRKINELFDKFNPKEILNSYAFYSGSFYDAYSFLLEIFEKSKKEIIIIDNYIGKEILNTLKNIKRKIIIVSQNIDEVLIKKYESQYSNIKFIKSDLFHDRFIMVDKKELYTCGTSLKDLGKKCFIISRLNSKEILDGIVLRIKNNLN